MIVGLFACDAGSSDPVPEVPTLIRPANGSDDAANALELQWNSSENASYYHLEVSSDPAFTDLIVDDQRVQSDAYPVSDLEIGDTYYWRLRAVNENGAGDWTSEWNFTPSKEAEIPGIPKLSYPGEKAFDLPTQIEFRWDPVDGATSYHIQVSMERNFRRRSADIEGVRDTSAIVRELVPTYTYFWRVRSQNPLGFGTWSQYRLLVVEDDDIEQRDTSG